jgi:hypothetical protein
MKEIVYVDDEPRVFLDLGTAKEADRIVSFVFQENLPDAEEAEWMEAASAASVWLFDFFLVAGETERPEENGLSLFQKWKAAMQARPTTVVVSSDLGKAVGGPIGPVERRHIIAQRHGVEWIGEKTLDTYRRVIALADAAVRTREGLKPQTTEGQKVGSYDPEHLCFNVLGVPAKAAWANSAQRQIDRARPPREVSVVSSSAAARSIVGWLVAHVLPYPSFLLTDGQAALRFGIPVDCFRAIVAGGKGNELVAECEYTGPLQGFLGRRWWRAAIDDVAWNLSERDENFRTAFETAVGTPVQWLEQDVPVLLSDADLVETDQVAEARDCVRVTDEDFPASIDPAWVLLTAAQKDKLLASKVIFEDRELLAAS